MSGRKSSSSKKVGSPEKFSTLRMKDGALVLWDGKRRITEKDEVLALSLMSEKEKDFFYEDRKWDKERSRQLRLVKWILLYNSLPENVRKEYGYSIERISHYGFWALGLSLRLERSKYQSGYGTAWRSYESGIQKMKELFETDPKKSLNN
jgi:hypothetical protein